MHKFRSLAFNETVAFINSSPQRRLVVIGLLAASVSACTTYEMEWPESPIAYCSQSPDSSQAFSQTHGEFEAISVPNWTEVYALKEMQGRRVVLISNQLTIDYARLDRFYDSFLWFKSLAGSKMVVSLSASGRSEEIIRAEQEILRRYPEAQFVRPWMAQVRLVPISPWIVRRKVILPCQGFPMKDVPMEFLLNREETLRLDDLPKREIVLNGTLSFVDLISGQFFHQSFSLRKFDLQDRPAP